MPLATPTIVVTDAANGSGANVVISGSNAGATNTAEITLTDRAGWVTTAYARTGDGMVNIGAGAGEAGKLNLTHAWRVRIKSTLAAETATSDEKIVLPTQGYDSPHFYAIKSAQLALIDVVTGIGGRVYRCMDPLTLMETHINGLPALLVYPPPEGEQRSPTNNAMTTWGYTVIVAIADRETDGYSQLELNCLQRMQTIDVFDRKKLEFVTTAKYRGRKVVVTPGPIVPVGNDQGKYQYHLSTIKLAVEVDRYIGGGSDRP